MPARHPREVDEVIMQRLLLDTLKKKSRSVQSFDHPSQPASMTDHCAMKSWLYRHPQVVLSCYQHDCEKCSGTDISISASCVRKHDFMIET